MATEFGIQSWNTLEDPAFSAEVAERLETVRRKAFEFYEARGGEHGYDVDDWLRAEKEVMGSTASEPKAAPLLLISAMAA